MITKNELKYYSSLQLKKNRVKERKFLVEGVKNVIEGLNSNLECELIFVTRKFSGINKKIISLPEIQTQKIIPLKQEEFLKISDSKSPQGIAAVFLNPAKQFEIKNFDEEIIVYLDQISDPGNLGTIIRNCDWFGIKTILISKNCVEYTNPKVIRSSMGSVFHINLIEEASIKSLTKLKKNNFEILCADTEGENIFKYRSRNKKVIILSSEAHGPSVEVENIADNKIYIPGRGNAESLNVASASAVILAEITRNV
jgi:RNA methyltransferase, TrmH family